MNGSIPRVFRPGKTIQKAFYIRIENRNRQEKEVEEHEFTEQLF
jgi:hypothetical protein